MRLYTHTHTHTFVLTNSFFKGNPFHSGNGCNRGISLIALIITIIVIIILAAISIAGVSGVVERSRYAKFCGDLDAVQDAVSQAYGDKLVDQSLENPTNRKSSKEIYEWVAGGEDPRTEEVDGKTLAELEESDRLGLDLPKYGDGKWYVDVNTGEVYLLPGFEYEDKIYSSKADIQNGGSKEPTPSTPKEIKITEVKITKDVEGAVEVEEGEQILENTPLYIHIEATSEDGEVTITPPVPHQITGNGDVVFTLTTAAGAELTHTEKVTLYTESITFTIAKGEKTKPYAGIGTYTVSSGMTWEQFIDSEIYNPPVWATSGDHSQEYHLFKKYVSKVFTVYYEYDSGWREYLSEVCEDYECNIPVKLDEEIKDGVYYCWYD